MHVKKKKEVPAYPPLERVYTNYKITNKINGMMYIGITRWNPKWRWVEHKAISKRSDAISPLYCALREFGTDCFTFEIIEQHSDEGTMLRREHELIVTFNTLYPNGYNLKE